MARREERRTTRMIRMPLHKSYKELVNAIFSKPRLLFKCVATGITILVTIITFQIIALSYKVKTWRK